MREPASALGFQLREHHSLRVGAGAATHEEATGEVFLVEGFEDVFAVDEAEEVEDLFELEGELGVVVARRGDEGDHLGGRGRGEGFGACAEEEVDVFGDLLGGFGARGGTVGAPGVEEGGEGLAEGVAEGVVAVEGDGVHGVEGVFEFEETGDHVGAGLVGDDGGAEGGDVGLPGGADGGAGGGDAGEEGVEGGEGGEVAGGEEGADGGGVGEEGEVLFEHFVLDDGDEGALGGEVEVEAVAAGGLGGELVRAGGEVVGEGGGGLVGGEPGKVGARDGDEAGLEVGGVEAEGGDEADAGEEEGDVDGVALVLAVVLEEGEDSAEELWLEGEVGGDVGAEEGEAGGLDGLEGGGGEEEGAVEIEEYRPDHALGFVSRRVSSMQISGLPIAGSTWSTQLQSPSPSPPRSCPPSPRSPPSAAPPHTRPSWPSAAQTAARPSPRGRCSRSRGTAPRGSRRWSPPRRWP